MMKRQQSERVVRMTKTINKGSIFVLFIFILSCSNTTSIECFSVDDHRIIHLGRCKVKSFNTSEAPFNYSLLFKCESGNEFEYVFNNVNGFLTLKTNTFSRLINTNSVYIIIDSLYVDQQYIYVLFQDSVDLNENRRVICANGYNQVFGERFGLGTPKVFLTEMDTSFAREIANILTNVYTNTNLN